MEQVKQQKRKDCPQCYRPNSVRIITEAGRTTEHCFGADCHYYISHQAETEFSDFDYTPKGREIDKKFLIDALSHPESREFLMRYHSAGVNCNIYYHIRDKRVVFNYKNTYTGRALDKTVNPKWYVYQTEGDPILVRKHRKRGAYDKVLLVEDAVSACAASHVMDTIALLGTTLRDSYLTEVLKYDKIYIALDEDASDKALKIQDTLNLVKDTKVVLLKKDIKYLGLNEIEELLNESK